MTAGPWCTRQVRVPALPAGLDDILDLIQELWTCVGAVSWADRIRFETAVMEIAGNIVQHSTPGQAAASVTMTFRAVGDAGTLRGLFVDDGQEVAVDLDGARMPAPGAHDGRGLAMALAVSDDVRYERRGATNRWTIVCRLAPDA